jgi:L-amino acid N-acyltransferase YncA
MSDDGRNVSIRDATPADAAAIVAILNPIIAARVYTVFDTPLSVETERE